MIHRRQWALAAWVLLAASLSVRGDEPLPADADHAADLDPTKRVFFNLRLQHEELGGGNTIDFVLFRRDAAIPRPRSWRPGAKLAILRFDIPVGNARLGGESTDGIGDLYAQALNVRAIRPKLSLASGLAVQAPTASEDVLGNGKWLVVPTVAPVWQLPERSMVFLKLQDFVSVGGDEARPDIHFLNVNPTYLRFVSPRNFMLIDSEAIVDWERNGDVSWKSGLLWGTVLPRGRTVWVKLEVPWGEHRRGDWSLEASIAFRRRR